MSEINYKLIAQRFAGALDRNDFSEARRCLSPECRYQIGGDELLGQEVILASYSDSAKWAEQPLDKVIYESEVHGGDAENMEVLFTDRIIHKGLTHEYRCRQRLSMNGAGKIIRIVHEELPGERERLNAFLESCGIRR